jgi:tartrate dehydrogenase/decarboxylase/D-malate dehydrogenase
MTTLRVAVYPGDGIGPEVTAEAVRVLAAAARLEPDLHIEFTTLPWGIEYWKQHGRVVPENFLSILRPFDAILLGAVGWPALLPDHETLWPLVQIRQAFDQYACMRPAKLYRGLPSVLANKGPDEIDFVVLRENSEGEYVDNGGRLKRGMERILRYGFEMARKRRKKLTMVTKSNAQRHAYVLWDDILAELAPQYPDVESERQHCDACAMNLVRWPEKFDVVVASNLFGDLLTDLGGVLAGGLGLAPSTNTNPEKKFPSMFEPVHGSAPDIAGQGIANPIAAILSAAMLLDHVDQPTAAARIRTAVERTLLSGAATRDLGGQLTTQEMGNAVLANVS